jgi:hypothetical protein
MLYKDAGRKSRKNSNRENNYDKSLNLQNDAFLSRLSLRGEMGEKKNGNLCEMRKKL